METYNYSLMPKGQTAERYRPAGEYEGTRYQEGWIPIMLDIDAILSGETVAETRIYPKQVRYVDPKTGEKVEITLNAVYGKPSEIKKPTL